MTDAEATQPRTEEEARAQGWKRNFVADEPRRSEMMETYRELGFAVITVPISLDSADCTECMTANPDAFQVIYTKKRAT